MSTGAPAAAPSGAVADEGIAGAPVVALSGVGKRFGGEPVLDDVDLVVKAGEVVALVGDNGAGKTTVVRAIAGALRPDAGTVRFAPGVVGADAGVAVVWQDLALCDNLDLIANLFLGREARRLDEEAMEAAGRRLLAGLGLELGDVRRPVGTLSGGERQLLAVARAMLTRPALLVLDEPTAALAVPAAHRVAALIEELRAAGTAVLLVSHRPEEVTELADRVVVLRRGRVVATLAAGGAHPDEVAALMAGAEVESTARRKLERLRGLAVQLSGTEAAGSLPLIVSAAATALGVDHLALHRLEPPENGGTARLRRLASVGLPDAFAAATDTLAPGSNGGMVGAAAAAAGLVVVDDFRHPGPAGTGDATSDAAVAAGLHSGWAAPIIGAGGVLGVFSGYSASAGRPDPDQLELVSLYAGYAAAAIERARLLGEVTRRNRMLENLRSVLEALAGPDRFAGGLHVALDALGQGLGADSVALVVGQDGGGIDGTDLVVRVLAHTRPPANATDRLDSDSAGVARAVVDGRASTEIRSDDGATVVGVRLVLPEGGAALVARWRAPARPGREARELLGDAAQSLRLALEREALEALHQETATLRRAHDIQRQFLFRLSHELRTPLTAIHGYASSLRQADVTWDEATEDRFLAAIVEQSARLARLVGDLLDSSALESGGLRLNCDWCDLGLILQAAAAGAAASPDVQLAQVACDPAVKPIWGDHDRLQQVFVNLIDNALRHTPAGTTVSVATLPGAAPGTVEIRVRDRGPGVPPADAEGLFLPYRRGATTAPGAGLGLSIARGIAVAHGGSLTIETPGDGVGACFLVTLPEGPPDGDGPDSAVWDARGGAHG